MLLPNFSRTYLSKYSESLLIPSSFYKHFPPRLPRTAILMGNGGKIWKVAMKSREGQVYFENGWSRFVTDNDLKVRDSLTFVFHGGHRFEVTRKGTRKKTRKTTGPTKIQNPEAYLDDPNNVCFETCLKNKNTELLVSLKLVRDHNLKFGCNIDYIQDNFDPLTAIPRRYKTRLAINKWPSICRRSKLTTNDLVLCELFRADNKVVHAIKVHIIRGGAAST